MRYKNKLHEFDHLAQSIKNDKLWRSNVSLFGAGIKGKKYFTLLQHFGIEIQSFVDNNPDLHGSMYLGVPVISLTEYMQKKKTESTLVITVAYSSVPDVVNQLTDNGLNPENDFYIIDIDFTKKLILYAMYVLQEVYIPTVQISLTERCTLRCKKCAHACNLVSSSHEDMSLNDVKASVDWLFKFADYIDEFVLIGGEPFLYDSLSEVIKYIGERYRQRMRVFQITTNGTIVPSDEVLCYCKKHEVSIHVSNYTNSIPQIKKRHEALVDKIEQYRVNYSFISSATQWMDYGFDYLNRQAKPIELENVFDKCFTPCHEIRNNKYYFCTS